MSSCEHCKSDRLVWDWANGDIVCTSCGTITQERFVDDNHYYKDYEDHEYSEKKTIDRKVNNVVCTINSVLYNGMVDDTNAISEKIQHSYENVDKKITTADIVAGIYTCEKGLTAKELCITMNVKPKKFWKSVKNDVVWEHRLLDIIKRLVYEAVKFDSKEEWKVIKNSMKIIEKIKKFPEVQNIKTDKLAISLIYIACKCGNVLWDKKEFLTNFRISFETLQRHEHIIQAILKKHSR